MPVTADLRLRPVRLLDEPAVRAAQAESAADGFLFVVGMDLDEPFADVVERMWANRLGQRLPDGWVPTTFLLAEVGGTVVGRTSIRHELNDFLLREGGHIGYCVRPAHRRRGHATEILRQSLVVIRSLGVDPVLVTCDEGNDASVAVIERCGGVLDNVVEVAGGPPKRRYWIA